MARLQDRIAVVTGAGRGIGFGIAQALCAEGATVAIAELDSEQGQQATETLKAQEYSALFYHVDVADSQTITPMVEDIHKRFGRIDILVNNAGISSIAPSVDLLESDWRRAIDVMLTGTFLCSQAVGRVMIAQRRGVILSISSIAVGGWPMRAAYCAAKAGVVGLTEVLAVEWAEYGIRVNAIAPGVTRTELVQKAITSGVAKMEQYEGRTPLKRLAEVKEIARVALFLVSDEASYITGSTVRVDGGWVAYQYF